MYNSSWRQVEKTNLTWLGQKLPLLLRRDWIFYFKIENEYEN